MFSNWFEMNWRVAVIILGTIVLYVLIDSFGKRAWITTLTQHSRRVKQAAEAKVEIAKRVETISSVFTKTSKALLVVVALAMILSELGVNITPIITGAGLIGVVFGLGAQSLIKDVVAGIFVIVEHQYIKGDEITLGDTLHGKVVHFSLRSTVLRDEAGVEYFISNGSVAHVANFSKHKVKG